MKIKAMLGIDSYSLMVCHCSGKLYHLSIVDCKNEIYSFEGIYSSLGNAIDRGKSVVKGLSYSKHIRSLKRDSTQNDS